MNNWQYTYPSTNNRQYTYSSMKSPTEWYNSKYGKIGIGLGAAAVASAGIGAAYKIYKRSSKREHQLQLPQSDSNTGRKAENESERGTQFKSDSNTEQNAESFFPIIIYLYENQDELEKYKDKEVKYQNLLFTELNKYIKDVYVKWQENISLSHFTNNDDDGIFNRNINDINEQIHGLQQKNIFPYIIFVLPRSHYKYNIRAVDVMNIKIGSVAAKDNTSILSLHQNVGQKINTTQKVDTIISLYDYNHIFLVRYGAYSIAKNIYGKENIAPPERITWKLSFVILSDDRNLDKNRGKYQQKCKQIWAQIKNNSERSITYEGVDYLYFDDTDKKSEILLKTQKIDKIIVFITPKEYKFGMGGYNNKNIIKMHEYFTNSIGNERDYPPFYQSFQNNETVISNNIINMIKNSTD